MGIIDMLFRPRPEVKALLPDPSPVTDEAWEHATVRRVEDAVARGRNWNQSKALAKFATNLALDAAMFNAVNMAAVTLRLYRKEGRGGGVATRQRMVTRPVGKRRMEHLRNPNAVGRKAAMMAEMSGGVVEVLDAEPLKTLRRPDPDSTGMAWDVARWRDKQLYGETLMLHTKQGHLRRMAPPFASVQPNTDGLIAGWYYGRDSVDVAEFEADEVVQMKWSEHPTNPYRGLGWLDLAIREIEIDDYALAAELTRWRQGGYPDAVVSFDGVKTPTQLEEAEKSLVRQLKRKLGFLLTTESRVQPLAMPKDMQYEQGLATVERRILNRARIPETLYKMQDANRAGAKEADPVYARYALMPALAVDAEQWTELWLPRFGFDPDIYFFAYDDVVTRDRAAKATEVVSLYAAGLLTQNEARAELDYDETDGGDDFKQEPQAQSFGYSPVLNVSTPKPEPRQEPAQAPTAGQEDAVAPEPVKAIKPVTIKSWGEVDPWACDHHDGCDCHATKAGPEDAEIRAFERALADYFKLVGSSITLDAIAAGKVDLSALDRELAASLEPLIAESLRAGALVGYGKLGRDSDLFDVVPQEALRIVQERGNLVSDLVGRTTEEAVARAIQEGVEQQLSQREVQKLVQGALSEASPHRAEMIARTEVAYAQGAGSTAAWTEAGIEQHRWLLAPDACSICHALVDKLGREGRESAAVPIGEPFLKAGETLVGVDGKKYTAVFDVYHEPLHPSDRCTTIPVIREAEQ